MIQRIYVAGQGGRYHGRISFTDFQRLIKQAIVDDVFRDVQGSYNWQNKPITLAIRLYLKKKDLLPYLERLGVTLMTTYPPISSFSTSGILEGITTQAETQDNVIYI